MKQQQLRVLFLSRKHPPSVGGMERLSYHLVHEMRSRVQTTAITWGGSQKLLPFFLPYALVRSLWETRRGVDLVSAGDPIMAVVGWIVKVIARVPVVAVAHGLDVTWGFRPYQWIIPRVLRHMDRVVCISESARNACVARGVAPMRCPVIYPGVSTPQALPTQVAARERLAISLGHSLTGMHLLLTVGRLVRRKGVVWFLESVYAELAAQRDDVHYVIVGEGPEGERIRETVTRLKLESRVSLTGTISEESLREIYAAADLFVMPNVVVPGDMEGFGLVALEAAAHGLPVLAADLEGIRAAVVNGQTGELVPAENVGAWREKIARLLDAPERRAAMARTVQENVPRQFGWGRMAGAYEDVFRAAVRQAADGHSPDPHYPGH